jgi:hypothetical protein
MAAATDVNFFSIGLARAKLTLKMPKCRFEKMKIANTKNAF